MVPASGRDFFGSHMSRTVIKNATIVNEGRIFISDLLIENGRISRISGSISAGSGDIIIDLAGNFLMPGIIDDQVHFRDPGFPEKATIESESRAAAAGGTTSFMDMPNTRPQTVTSELLDEKLRKAARDSLVNYGFFLGATNTNIEEIKRLDPRKTAGVKVFMGSSTGNMLVDSPETLEQIFRYSPVIIATHCEDMGVIDRNTAEIKDKYGDNPPFSVHPEIRSAEACLKSSSLAIELAQKTGANLHIFHLSTREETELLRKVSRGPLEERRITAEVCMPHLTFTSDDYENLGRYVKCNLAVKGREDRHAPFRGLADGTISLIATDHAPHAAAEKEKPYFSCPSGIPMIQFTLPLLLEFYNEGRISLETIAMAAAHNPAVRYQIRDRGFIREGYFADLTAFSADELTVPSESSILSLCGWSPLAGRSIRGRVLMTMVNGNVVYENGKINDCSRGQQLAFDR